VTGKVVAAGKQRGFVDRRGHDPVDFARLRQLDGSLDREPAESAGAGSIPGSSPLPHRDVDVRGRIRGADHHNVTALADP